MISQACARRSLKAPSLLTKIQCWQVQTVGKHVNKCWKSVVARQQKITRAIFRSDSNWSDSLVPTQGKSLILGLENLFWSFLFIEVKKKSTCSDPEVLPVEGKPPVVFRGLLIKPQEMILHITQKQWLKVMNCVALIKTQRPHLHRMLLRSSPRIRHSNVAWQQPWQGYSAVVLGYCMVSITKKLYANATVQ